jgi:hypothetical protein
VSVDKKRKLSGRKFEVFDKLIKVDGRGGPDGKIPSVIWVK